MKKFGCAVFILTLSFLSFWGECFATTNCDQSFTFVGRTKGSNPVFWIGEDVGGECFQSYLHLLAVSGSKVNVITSDLELQDDWEWLLEGMKRFDLEVPLELVKKIAAWGPKTAKWTVTAPLKNDKLMAEFDNDVIQKGQALSDWNRVRKLKGVDLPVLDKISAQALYFHPGGLYVNYSISKVLYFAKSGYILVFTHQDKPAVGLDTMHGFILLRRSR